MNAETALVNDLRVAESKHGGWVFVHLRDSDDGDTFQLGEDEIVALHRHLGAVIEKHGLAQHNKD